MRLPNRTEGCMACMDKGCVFDAPKRSSRSLDGTEIFDG